MERATQWDRERERQSESEWEREDGREGRQHEAVAVGQEEVRPGDWQVDGCRAAGAGCAWLQGFVAIRNGSPLFKMACEIFTQ